MNAMKMLIPLAMGICPAIFPSAIHAEEGVGAIDKRSLVQREKLQSAIIHIEAKTSYTHNGRADVQSRSSRMVLDGKRTRMDYRKKDQAVVECIHCIHPDSIILASSRRDLAVTVNRWPDEESSFYEMFDARSFGYNPSPMQQLRGKSFDWIIGRRPASTRVIRKTESDGRDVYIATSVNQANIEMEITYSISEGCHPVFFRMKALSGPDPLYSETNIELQKVSEDLWYPRRIHYFDRFGGVTRFDETIEFKVSSVNQPIDPDEFELQTMGLQKGRIIIDDVGPPKNTRIWVNGIEVDREQYNLAQRARGEAEVVPVATPVDPGKISSFSYLRLCIAVAAGLLGVGLVFLYLRRRRP